MRAVKKLATPVSYAERMTMLTGWMWSEQECNLAGCKNWHFKVHKDGRMLAKVLMLPSWDTPKKNHEMIRSIQRLL